MIDPGFLAELDRFDAAIDRHVNSLFRGEQQTSIQGEGLTFSDYRNYVPGDDTRLIDWKIYARTDELFVKQFEEERNLTVHVLLDGSESMAFGTDSKFEYAAKIGLGFCYLTATENNDFRFSVFRDDLQRLDGGASTVGELLRVIDRLNEMTPEGDASFESALSSYTDLITSRSIVLILSDFLEPPEELTEGVRALAEHEIVLTHVIAPEETAPPVSGETIFEGMESPAELRTYFGGRAKGQYQSRLQTHIDQVESIAEDFHARFVTVNSGDDFFESFTHAWFETPHQQ